MPILIVKQPGANPVSVSLVKPLTSLGHGNDHDIDVADPALVDSVIVFENEQGLFSASAIEGAAFTLNGRKHARHRLSDGDTLRVGQTEVTFHSEAPPRATPGVSLRDKAGGEDLESLQALLAFSESLLAVRDTDKLLESLIDHVIRITRADKGFLALAEGRELHVKVARNMERQNVANAIENLSDSIVREVLSTRLPVIVSDALEDAKFSQSESVVNLELRSVLCVPLLERGGEPFGLIYLGNNRVANLFEKRSLDLLTIYAAQASLLVRNALLLNELSVENRQLKKAREEQKFGEIIGSSDAMKEIYRKLEKVAPTDISVLITGETGTGKELIARELHERSTRRTGPFITINCGAIPENLLESELFGHVRGAFTGAVATRIGRFQAANGGTLFLDEVGELPLNLQVKLLRALQEKVVSKVGETRSESVDIRIVAATNRTLEDEIREGRFREDLFYRLNVVGLHLPPLRERGDDLELLAKHLLQRFAREFGSDVRGFSAQATQSMRRYPWPGNIRQLENRIKKAVVLSDGPLVLPEDLDLRSDTLEPVVSLSAAVEEFKERYIDEVLKRNNENRTKTARDLGVDARTIFRYLERKRARLEGRTLVDEEDDGLSEG